MDILFIFHRFCNLYKRFEPICGEKIKELKKSVTLPVFLESVFIATILLLKLYNP